MQYARRFSFGRCLVLLSVYMLGMVLGSAIMLSLDVSRVILEPVRTARDTIPGFSQVSFLLPLASVPLSLSLYYFKPLSPLLRHLYVSIPPLCL